MVGKLLSYFDCSPTLDHHRDEGVPECMEVGDSARHVSIRNLGGPKVVAEHLRGLLGRVEHGLTSHLAREPGSDRRGQVRTYGLTDLSPGRDVGLTPLRPEVERMGLDHFLASGTT
jgi:hypothetical protein